MRYFKCRNVKSPERGTAGSAGIDFFVPEDFTPQAVDPGSAVNIPAGLHVLVPPGHALVMFNKSGVAVKHGLQVGACVIDEDYQGEIHIHLMNVSNKTVHIGPGMKMVQGLILEVDSRDLSEVNSLDELYGGTKTQRGDGAFGSTGEY